MKTQQKGEIAKLKVELRAAQLGYTVSRTVEGARYDLVIDDGKKLYRVQVKYAAGRSGNVAGVAAVWLLRKNGLRDLRGKAKFTTYSKADVDAILVYLPAVDKICWLSPKIFDGKRALYLRYAPPKNGHDTHLAVADYEW